MPVAQLSSVESFVHRDYAVLFGAMPAIALSSIATFVLRDRAAAGRSESSADTGAAQELALAGVLLALIAERLELDPLSYPLLAVAAAGLVDRAGAVDRAVAARRAAVDVIRPLALSTLVRSALCGMAG